MPTLHIGEQVEGDGSLYKRFCRINDKLSEAQGSGPGAQGGGREARGTRRWA